MAKSAINWLNDNDVNYVIHGFAGNILIQRVYRYYLVSIDDLNHAAQFRLMFPDFRLEEFSRLDSIDFR